MKSVRLEELPIKHFEYIFTPTGMPLVAKGEDEHGTTSILVRGGAGTGKTTLALALAHAIAKAGGGLVFYLTTEFSPAEIAFKATLIGLSEEAVDAWPGGEGAAVGSVVVEHLSEVRRGRAVLSSAERKKSSIDAVWGLLHPENEGVGRPPLPVRSVVIDALTLPDAGEEERALRTDLVNFVQALENEGISVVLVEELASGTPAWSAFVVDIVLELTFSADADTHELRRRLTLSKCRYSTSLPGPHDYGLEGTTIAVWPDLLRVATGGHDRDRLTHIEESPRLALPDQMNDEWVFLGPAIIVAQPGNDTWDAHYALERTPGLKEFDIYLGSVTNVVSDSVLIRSHDNQGPFAAAWAALSASRASGANFCLVRDVERMLSRQGWETPIIHFVEALRELGFMVCILSGQSSRIQHVADSLWSVGSTVTILPKRRHVWATRFLLSSFHELRNTPLQIPKNADIRRAHIEKENNSSKLGDIVTDAAKAPVVNDESVLAALTLAWSGSRKARDRIVEALNLSKSDKPRMSRFAWLAIHLGADWHAGRAARKAVESESPDASMLLLWNAICAAIAGNTAAIDNLKAMLNTSEEIVILDPLLRGLAKTNQLTEADRIIDIVGSRHNLPPWMLARVQAETRLDTEDLAAVQDAATRLEALSNDKTLPLVHRAEIWHNLGVARDRLGERNEAIATFRQATQLNPHLDAAREELEKLSASKTPGQPSTG